MPRGSGWTRWKRSRNKLAWPESQRSGSIKNLVNDSLVTVQSVMRTQLTIHSGLELEAKPELDTCPIAQVKHPWYTTEVVFELTTRLDY